MKRELDDGCTATGIVEWRGAPVVRAPSPEDMAEAAYPASEDPRIENARIRPRATFAFAIATERKRAAASAQTAPPVGLTDAGAFAERFVEEHPGSVPINDVWVVAKHRDAQHAPIHAADRAEITRLRAQLGAIDSISEAAWEDGEAATWVSKIRSGEALDGLPTQEAYEERFLARKVVADG